jgi:hypothetical protein
MQYPVNALHCRFGDADQLGIAARIHGVQDCGEGIAHVVVHFADDAQALQGIAALGGVITQHLVGKERGDDSGKSVGVENGPGIIEYGGIEEQSDKKNHEPNGDRHQQQRPARENESTLNKRKPQASRTNQREVAGWRCR